MIELLFSLANAFLSVLLLGLLFYWILVIIGAATPEGIDIDINSSSDFDVKSDINLDYDAQTSVEDLSNVEIRNEDIRKRHQTKLSPIKVFLVYFNFVELPFMFSLTVYIFIWWFLTISATYLTHLTDHWLGLIVSLVLFLPSLVIGKTLTNPLKGFFKYFKPKGEESLVLTGREATLLSRIHESRLGMAELQVNGDVMRIYVKSLKGDTIESGQKILLIRQSDDKKFFFVETYI